MTARFLTRCADFYHSAWYRTIKFLNSALFHRIYCAAKSAVMHLFLYFAPAAPTLSRAGSGFARQDSSVDLLLGRRGERREGGGKKE
jgi:hypothetical protein